MRTPTERGLLIGEGLNDLYQDTGCLRDVINEYDGVMADQACFLSSNGISWRRFYVGGCAVVLAVEDWAQDLTSDELLDLDSPTGEIFFLEGANNSPFEGSPRDCPELTFCGWSEEIARKTGRAIMPRVYTRGPSDPNVIATCTGVPLKTLPFCYTCGPAMTNCNTTWGGMLITTQALDRVSGKYIREEHTLDTMNTDFRRRRQINPPPLSSSDALAQVAMNSQASLVGA